MIPAAALFLFPPTEHVAPSQALTGLGLASRKDRAQGGKPEQWHGRARTDRQTDRLTGTDMYR